MKFRRYLVALVLLFGAGASTAAAADPVPAPVFGAKPLKFAAPSFGGDVQYGTVCENGRCRLVPLSGFSGGPSPFVPAQLTSDPVVSQSGPSGWWLGKNVGRPAPRRFNK